MKALGLAVFLPVVAAIIGWTTKWMALKLIFKPERFIGIGPIGWQGIAIRRAGKFSAGIADTVSGAALDVDEMFDRIDGVELAEVLAPALETAGPEITRTVLDTVKPGSWDSMAPEARDAMAGMLAQQSRTITAEVVEELKPVVKESLDLHELITSLLSGENAPRLARLVQVVAAHELRWIIWYGAIMGFIIGCVEVGFYLTLERWWILPIVGAFDGVVNNWLAIQMIFMPRERKKYLGIFPYQGMFPARQAEISKNYADMMATEILTFDNISALLERTGGSAKIAAAARESIFTRLAPMMGMVAGSVGVEATPELTERVLDAATEAATTSLGAEIERVSEYIDKRLELQATMEQRLAALPKEDFEMILRSIFKEDEATLITLGGVLGTGIGTLQALIVVASGLGK